MAGRLNSVVPPILYLLSKKFMRCRASHMYYKYIHRTGTTLYIYIQLNIF